jgi:small acid-soluble spore protein (thioredoxin-like protein)
MKSKPKSDDRSDNVERIQHNIHSTIRNIEAADELMAEVDNSKTKEELEAKNERRKRALDGMRSEIKDEAEDRKKR